MTAEIITRENLEQFRVKLMQEIKELLANPEEPAKVEVDIR